MTHDQARRIARDPSADPFLRYDAHKVLSTPEPLPKPERERKLDTTRREPDWSAWNRWADERIQAALIEQQRFLLAIVAEALGEHVAKKCNAVKRELAEELQRRLRNEFAEAQADRAKPLDRPQLPRPHLN
jgi:CHASE3 domain sensor protein